MSDPARALVAGGGPGPSRTEDGADLSEWAGVVDEMVLDQVRGAPVRAGRLSLVLHGVVGSSQCGSQCISIGKS